MRLRRPSVNPAAERMRLHRERRRRGLRCVTIELRETEIEALVRMGLLRVEARENYRAVCDALYEHFDRTLGLAAVTGNTPG
jgi:hypothetical protein